VRRPTDLSIRFKLVFEDLSEIPKDPKAHIEISCDRNKDAIEKSDEKIEVRSYWFNCTSYQNKGRKFRLIVELFHELSGNVAVRYQSKSFLIRAKRPIAKPGSRKRKLENDTTSSQKPTKRQKTSAAAPKVEQKRAKPVAQVEPSTPQPAEELTVIDISSAPLINTPPQMEKKCPPQVVAAVPPFKFLNTLQATSQQGQMLPTSFEYEKNSDYWNAFIQQQVSGDQNDCSAEPFMFPQINTKPQQSEAFQVFDDLLTNPDDSPQDLFGLSSDFDSFFDA